MFISRREIFKILHRSLSWLPSLRWLSQDADTTSIIPYLDHVPPNLEYPRQKADSFSNFPSNERDPIVFESRKVSKWNDDQFPNPKSPFAFIDFHRLESPAEIMESLVRSRRFLQLRQIVAALTRLRFLGLEVTPKILTVTMDLAEETLGSCRRENVIGLMFALARFKLTHRVELLVSLAKITMEGQFLQEMSLRELATLIHSIGFLLRWSRKHPVPLSGSVEVESRPTGYEVHDASKSGMHEVEELLELAIEEFALYRNLDHEFELRLPSVLTSLSHFGQKDFRLDQFVKFLAISLTETQHLTADQSSSVIYAFVNCRIHDRNLLEKLCMELTKPERLGKFQTGSLVGVMEALGKLRFDSYGVWYAVFLELTQKIRLLDMTVEQCKCILRTMISSRMNQDQERVMPVYEEITSSSRLSNLSTQDAQIFLILASHFPNSFQLDGTKLLQKSLIQSSLKDMECRELMQLIKGCSKFEIQDASVIALLVKEIQKAERMMGFTVDEIVSSLHSLLQIGKTPSGDLEHIIMESLSPNRINQLGRRQQHLLIEVLGNLKFNPGHRLHFLLHRFQAASTSHTIHQSVLALAHIANIPCIQREDIQSLINQLYEKSRSLLLRPSDTSVLVKALGELGVYHVGIMAQFCRSISRQYEALVYQDVINCFVGCAKLHYRTKHVIDLLLITSNDILGFETFTSIDLVILLHCLRSLQITTEHYSELIAEATSLMRLRELQIQEVVLLVLCLYQIDKRAPISDKEPILRLTAYLAGHQNLSTVKRKNLKKLRSCLKCWNVQSDLSTRISPMVDQYNDDEIHWENGAVEATALFLMDSKRVTASLAERLLDGR